MIICVGYVSEVVAYLNEIYAFKSPKKEGYKREEVKTTTIMKELAHVVSPYVKMGDTVRSFEKFCTENVVDFMNGRMFLKEGERARMLYVLKKEKRGGFKVPISNENTKVCLNRRGVAKNLFCAHRLSKRDRRVERQRCGDYWLCQKISTPKKADFCRGVAEKIC